MIPKTNSTEIQYEVLISIKEVYEFDSELNDRMILLSIFDDSGIQHSRHAYKGKQPGTALGDNPLVHESEDEDDESVEDIFESINNQYKKFMEGL